MVGFGRPAGGFRILRNDAVNDSAPHVTVQEAETDPNCYVCGNADPSVPCHW